MSALLIALHVLRIMLDVFGVAFLGCIVVIVKDIRSHNLSITKPIPVPSTPTE